MWQGLSDGGITGQCVASTQRPSFSLSECVAGAYDGGVVLEQHARYGTKGHSPLHSLEDIGADPDHVVVKGLLTQLHHTGPKQVPDILDHHVAFDE